jgi:hypothetical protein
MSALDDFDETENDIAVSQNCISFQEIPYNRRVGDKCYRHFPQLPLLPSSSVFLDHNKNSFLSLSSFGQFAVKQYFSDPVQWYLINKRPE